MASDLVECICGNMCWDLLPDPVHGRSVTTDGHILMQGLEKAQCAECGLVQRIAQMDRPLADFYSEEYAVYNRPGAESFDKPRYRAMAQWIADSAERTGLRAPQKIVEIGCGKGWALAAMQDIHPNAEYIGVEPSAQAASVARASGLNIVTAAAGEGGVPSHGFDLVYSNNVIEHTPNPVEFLRSLKKLVTPEGRIVISCPDGTHPALDMMFADHLYTFAPLHLLRLAHDAGLVPLWWEACPKQSRLRHEQLLVCACEGDAMAESILPGWDKSKALQARRDYFSAWGMLDDYFELAIGKAENIYLFGAGEWGFLLSGYAPRVWERLSACTVDGYEGVFLGKKVVDYATLKMSAADAIIIGTNPDSQQHLAARLAANGQRAITWNHLVPR